MKKIIIIAMVAMLMPMTGNAQLNGLLKEAARKTANKTTEKLVNKASDRLSKSVEKEVEKRLDASDKEVSQPTKLNATYEGIMRQLPELPSADQLVKYKEAELNEKTLRLVTSKVTIFTAKVLELSSQCTTLGYEDMDSAQATDAAMRMASAYTGLSQAELEQLSTMSEEEQQAWLQAHYSQQQAETAMLKQAVDASKWLEPLQPDIDQWTAASEKAEAAYKDLESRLRPIYGKYASKLAQANGQERTNLLLAYYTEAVPHIRTAVQNALNIRLKEQLPIAEKIEKKMASIRAEHPDAISQLLNYPKLTATQYFTETSRLLDIPQYDD